jgi:hypothetical protein
MFREKVRAVRTILRRFAPMLLAATFALPVLCNGCAAHVRVYDPYYHDYHGWAAEEPYYSQWEHDTHHEHMDFKKRDKADQKAYWDWRHSQH